ncbi:MAG: hypothetical protein N3F67_06125 [Acidilobaceae archaeon]|nr:hypothetical protein [Acidilobaceae archaeon]
MSVSIPLLPMHTLGRNFQLLALALGDKEGQAKIRAETDSIEFPSADAYVRFVKNTYEALYRLHVGKVRLLEREVPEGVEGEVCGRGSPQLYGNDQKHTYLAGKTVCARATSYVRAVMRGGPLKQLVPLPYVLRATLYSKERPSMPIKDKVSLDSVGMAYLGMVGSYVGRKEDIEYYLVPADVTDPAYVFAVLQVLKMPAGEELPVIVRKLEDINLSTDIATYLGFLLKALKAEEAGMNAFGLAREAAYEKFLVVKVRAAGNRPDVTWAAPLSLSVPLEMTREQQLQEALKSVYILASSARRGKDRERAEDVVRECFNSLALSIFTNVHPVGREELSYRCIRAAIVAFQDDETSGPLKGLTGKIIRALGR